MLGLTSSAVGFKGHMGIERLMPALLVAEGRLLLACENQYAFTL